MRFNVSFCALASCVLLASPLKVLAAEAAEIPQINMQINQVNDGPKFFMISSPCENPKQFLFAGSDTIESMLLSGVKGRQRLEMKAPKAVDADEKCKATCDLGFKPVVLKTAGPEIFTCVGLGELPSKK